MIRSIWCRAISARDVGRRADDSGIDDALADPRRVVVDEPDDAVGEFVLGENLAHHLARRLAGADDEDALLHAERSGQAA